ncbi:glycosyltransferase [Cerasicoccus arenae]|uniref:Glycosyltransferase n=1 Tax=Cerasicoccus arenae TaxID=424488 RepID=A0A8J3DE04_9BACT|nr:glycosyltransferase [Cerasicoccus arenae]MBK1857487.1 hypothetical protein [Cerasicoccus arenae]GHB95311.1 hypothetical protein GCM10007047_08770 [Cerasicoccus arenae]
MRSIGLICGSLEPNRNGVGDYSRRLAQALNTLGESTIILALADPYVETPTEELQDGIMVLRLPEKLTKGERKAHLTSWLDTNQPRQLILQYVPFAYHYKGLPWTTLSQLKKSIGSIPLHWMCHETWCGLGRECKLKERLLGIAQQALLRHFIKGAKSVCTSIPYYRTLLSKIIATPVHLLPIYSNIPLRAPISDKTIADYRLNLASKSSAEDLFILLFGRIAADFPADEFLLTLDKMLKQAGLRAYILSAGQIDRGEGAWEAFQSAPTEQIEYLRLGELSSDNIDKLIQAVDFGLATTPLESIGKSSTSIAILERGKPVIAHGSSDTIGIAPELFPSGQILQLKDLNSQLFRDPPSFPVKNLTPHVAQQLLKILAS